MGDECGRLHEWGRALADLVFPPTCVDCGDAVEASTYRYVCVKCAPRFDYAADPCCLTCGHPFYGEVEGERLCPHCEGLRPEFREGRTAVLYKGPAKALIHELKYHRGLHVIEDVAEIFRRSPRVCSWARGAVLVPVPLHARKLRERGYNQSELIAEALAFAAGEGTRIERILQRVIDTASQTAFDRQARRANLKNAFALARGASITPGQHYILVDDVFTTGSTLNSCAGVLRHAGCLNLDVVTFGHG